MKLSSLDIVIMCSGAGWAGITLIRNYIPLPLQPDAAYFLAYMICSIQWSLIIKNRG